jgi:hypothetical protein
MGFLERGLGMKKAIVCLAMSMGLLIGAGSASATGGNDSDRGTDSDRVAVTAKFCKKHTARPVCKRQPRAVPEIDATSGTQAIALVLGVSLLGAERLRRRPHRAS